MIAIDFCDNTQSMQFSPNNGDLYVEDVVTAICKKKKLRPLCQTIFGLQIKDIKNNKGKVLFGHWLSFSRKISSLQNKSYQFRIRFMPPSSDTLKILDSNSYAYLFYQIRYDFLSGCLPEHTHQPKDALGLVVTDIVHHLLVNTEKRIGDLDISAFMPKSLNSLANRYNVKSTTENLLRSNSDTFNRRGPEYIRYNYLGKIEEIGRVGGQEKYCSVRVEDGGVATMQPGSLVDLIVDPFQESRPGIFYQVTTKKAQHVCTIEELVFVSVRKQDVTVELFRENGVPLYLHFETWDALESFVSCLTGYYRLMKAWTFDLCRELPTPSLKYLRSNKCHGPVGKEFALKKVRTKGGGEKGVGVLRTSSLDYGVYKLSVSSGEDELPRELVILEEDGQVHFKDSEVLHSSVGNLMKWATKTNFGDVALRRVLPPSDLDAALQLLIYAKTTRKRDGEGGDVVSAFGSAARPRVMTLDEFIVKDKLPLRGRFSDVYHVRWSRDTSQELAIKVVKLKNQEKESYLSSLNNFLFVEGDCIIKVFGVTLSPLTLVMEFLPLGPLNVYLRNHSHQMRQVDLVEASSYLAKALWDLHSRGITHHRIRCRNILVANHTDQRFKVKLGDPGKVEYTTQDIHWLPREHLMHPSSALTDPHVDTWAFATTLWEMFSLGESPLPDSDPEEVRALYAKGFMLSRPALCPKEIFQVMIGCWHPDAHSRRHPQAIMRDIKQIFYYIFNSRRENPYEKLNLNYVDVSSEEREAKEQEDEDEDEEDQLSVSTEVTTLTQTDGSLTQVEMRQIIDYPFESHEVTAAEFDSLGGGCSPMMQDSTENLTLKSLLVLYPSGIQKTEASSPIPPIELNNCSIEILERIGKGNYGYVFKGKRTFRNGKMEYVALKRLQSVGSTSDFKKEMKIMKNLQHENIVQFHCLAESDQEGSCFQYMVMEYLSLGSLQDYLLSNKDDSSLTSDRKLLAFSMDIAKGMDYLESQQIIHRDLAARNVLVSCENHVKITDFGLAQRPNQGNYYILRTVREMPIRWYALESVERGKFSHKTDVWSYGVTLWEMFTRGLIPDLPNDGAQLIETLKKGTRLICKAPCRPFIYSKLIRPCWDEDPSMRPEFTKIISVICELEEELQ